ncbi:hypothetical protein, partial [Providencia rettgeri]|uniref:hypothetical protein n=1 Tax=Providencia rettgeri TaxID=587 RepID=UPI0030101437
RFSVHRALRCLVPGQWMRIIGSQKNLATPFLHYFVQLLHSTAKPPLIPTYSPSYPQHENNLKITAHYANVCVTIDSKFQH